MRLPSFYSRTTLAVATGVIVVSTAILSYFSYYYTVGRENLVENSLVQANIKLATQYVDRIEQKIIDNDRQLSSLVDVDEPGRWPEFAETIRSGDFNVEQVYFLRPDDNYPLYPPFSYDIRDSWNAFRLGFRLSELNLNRLVPDQVHHLHKERADNYFFASYVLKESSKGERYIVCFQMSQEKILVMLDRFLRDLRPNFYVSIVDFDSNGVYSQPISRSGTYFYERRFPTTLYKWLLQVVPRNYTEIETNARNQRRIYLVLIVASMLLIFCSVAVIYVAGTRERQLAQLKEDFISHVSHELKTPLSLISMFSEILLSGRSRTEQATQEYYGIIHTESNRMMLLVNNLLDFARFDRESGALRWERINIAGLVDRELEGYRIQVQRDGFQITKEIEQDIPDTLADPTAITTAFFNLLDNSVKYSGERKEILVQVRRSDGFVDLSVSDQGPGIPADEHEKIFEKFYRGSSAARAQVRGSGIGLSITKRVAEMHGGEVRVHSRPGAGSRFTLRIPLREVS
ncbi:MAG: HAMP domain-containing sensor histidine kinase [Acidobacteriota bacterium]